MPVGTVDDPPPAGGAAEATPRRPDASMDLLRVLRAGALDPGYAEAARRPSGPRRSRGIRLVTFLIFGLLLGTAVSATLRSAPEASAERAELIARIQQAEASVAELQRTATLLEEENAALSDAGDDATTSQLAELGALTGASAVAGPGLVLRLDDGEDPAAADSRVVDTDLRMIVNGLRGAGAEAIAINGHRLTTRTAIRNAGDAITVNYRSLVRPYVIEAIGDASAMRDGFVSSEGGRWLAGLQQHFGIRATIETSRSLRLGADPGLRVSAATAVR